MESNDQDQVKYEFAIIRNYNRSAATGLFQVDLYIDRIHEDFWVIGVSFRTREETRKWADRYCREIIELTHKEFPSFDLLRDIKRLKKIISMKKWR